MTRKQTDTVTPTVAPVSRALSASDKRNLEKLVKQDFELLRQELDIVRNEVTQQRLAEIDQRMEADTKLAASIEAEGNKAVEDLLAAIAELDAKARTLGFTTRHQITNYLNRSHSEYTVIAHTVSDAKRKAQDEVTAEYQRGLLSVNQKEAEVLRTVYMAGLTEEANAVLDTIPSAREVMAGIRKAREVAA